MHSPVQAQDSQVSSPAVGVRAEGNAISQPSAEELGAVCEPAGAPSVEPVAAVSEQEPAAALPPIDEVVDVQSTKDSATTASAVSNEDCSSDVARGFAPPRKRLERVNASWIGEDTVMTVSPDDFVFVWADSTTPLEWIYAEHLSDTNRVGWLPTFVFEILPTHQRWMKATSSLEVVNETQLKVRLGNVFKISVNTRTQEGWVYAELVCDGDGHPLDEAGTAPAGWVPDFCFEWTEE